MFDNHAHLLTRFFLIGVPALIGFTIIFDVGTSMRDCYSEALNAPQRAMTAGHNPSTAIESIDATCKRVSKKANAYATALGMTN